MSANESETRPISLEVTPDWFLEYDRNIRIKLRHNAHQATNMDLSLDEAYSLLAQLYELLELGGTLQ